MPRRILGWESPVSDPARCRLGCKLQFVPHTLQRGLQLTRSATDVSLVHQHAGLQGRSGTLRATPEAADHGFDPVWPPSESPGAMNLRAMFMPRRIICNWLVWNLPKELNCSGDKICPARS